MWELGAVLSREREEVEPTGEEGWRGRTRGCGQRQLFNLLPYSLQLFMDSYFRVIQFCRNSCWSCQAPLILKFSVYFLAVSWKERFLGLGRNFVLVTRRGTENLFFLFPQFGQYPSCWKFTKVCSVFFEVLCWSTSPSCLIHGQPEKPTGLNFLFRRREQGSACQLSRQVVTLGKTLDYFQSNFSVVIRSVWSFRPQEVGFGSFAITRGIYRRK